MAPNVAARRDHQTTGRQFAGWCRMIAQKLAACRNSEEQERENLHGPNRREMSNRGALRSAVDRDPRNVDRCRNSPTDRGLV